MRRRVGDVFGGQARFFQGSAGRTPSVEHRVGGGVIGCEFACILSDLGTRVTVVEALDRLLPLPSVDAGCSKVLQREMKKKKIKFLLNKTVTAVDTNNAKASVTMPS